MRVTVNKKEWEWFKLMREEGRTRSMKIHSYPTLNPESNEEIELDLREVKKMRATTEMLRKKTYRPKRKNEK